jgi:hypothetical protein
VNDNNPPPLHILFTTHTVPYSRHVKQHLVMAPAIVGFVSTSGVSVATALELITLREYIDSI